MTPYRTAAGYGEAEYEDKRSRFIGHIKPVTSENEAKAFIDEMRRTYADATHNVFAYVLREGNKMCIRDRYGKACAARQLAGGQISRRLQQVAARAL